MVEKYFDIMHPSMFISYARLDVFTELNVCLHR